MELKTDAISRAPAPAEDPAGEPSGFDRRVAEAEGRPLTCGELSILQVNIGLRCNQQCVHCHVASSPKRKEMMSWETMAQVIRVARAHPFQLIDITGGAPEIHPEFRRFVAALRADDQPVQVRTNLTILLEPGFEEMAPFLRDQRVRLVASMPCYLRENVDAQRGDGVYERSVRALQRLNALGYGVEPELQLSLVYNPGGGFLPPEQAKLEADYRRELRMRHDVVFTNLIALANMPIGRFRTDLGGREARAAYEAELRASFNPATLCGLMCRHQVEVGWDGTLYDCDFNLALRLPTGHGAPRHIDDFDLDALTGRRVVTGEHCFGCTAGAGSSCGGALA